MCVLVAPTKYLLQFYILFSLTDDNFAIMAPQELVSRYKEYKSKTRGLLYWLTRTASTCCDLTTVLSSLASKSKSDAVQADNTGELEIRADELLALAEKIASADPPVEVPEGVLLIIRDIIAGREGCAEWYSAQALVGGSKVAKENESHRHFIEVCITIATSTQQNIWHPLTSI